MSRRTQIRHLQENAQNWGPRGVELARFKKMGVTCSLKGHRDPCRETYYTGGGQRGAEGSVTWDPWARQARNV